MSCGAPAVTQPPAPSQGSDRASSVCPPFPLRDEAGKPIDPIKGVNDSVPYSPRQTCGATGCHDYARITEGFHFTQGKGERISAAMAERYAWVTSPGNYGGNWCSPAPLYRQLAPKANTGARAIDMTSFDFVTATCGNCHPGGGPLEFDRDGRRYDTWMRDPSSGLSPGGENGLDGDYYKARWTQTGVIEADCLLCHMPEYNYQKRNAELANLNFRWAATVGAGFGTVTGAVNANEQPTVSYDKSKFDANANVIVHMAPEPRNETCQTCHIPARAVRSALVQASDVYNPAPRITPPPKRIWAFYDQEMSFWNHYGELELFTSKDQPTHVTRPTLILP